MRRKSSYSYRKDAYYFTIKSSPRDITMFRDTKKAAAQTYGYYESVGKRIEWLGKWNGKKFEETTIPTVSNE